MNARMIFAMMILLLGSLALVGCSSDNENEGERLVCEVESVNLGNPLISFYMIEVGEGDYSFPIDVVPVVFRARPFSSAIVLPEDAAFSWFHITSYDLIWHPGAGCPEEITDHNITDGYCDILVESGEEGYGSILIADRLMKEEPWFWTPLLDPTAPSYSANCELIFKGHESGSDRVVEIPGGMYVTFYGVGLDD